MDPYVIQLALWPDPTFEGNRTRRYRHRRNPYDGSKQWRCRRGEVIQRHGDEPTVSCRHAE